MAPKLYKMDLSPPARAAMMIVDLLEIPVDEIDVNLLAKDHMKPEYLEKNPLHSVPMLEDGYLVINDSHAILTYLADAYSKDESLYPKNLNERTLVNQKLFFDSSILFPRLRSITYSTIFEGLKKPTEQQVGNVEEAYGFLEAFLNKSKWLAGSNMTIADISCVADVSALADLIPLDASKFPKTQAWLCEIQRQPFYLKRSAEGGKALTEIVKQKWASYLQ